MFEKGSFEFVSDQEEQEEALMPNERRLERLEEKIDGTKDGLSELCTDFKVHVTNIENKLDRFEGHILENLPSIREAVEEFNFEKRLKKEKFNKRRKVSWILGSISLVVGIVAGVVRLI